VKSREGGFSFASTILDHGLSASDVKYIVPDLYQI